MMHQQFYLYLEEEIQDTNFVDQDIQPFDFQESFLVIYQQPLNIS